VRTVLRRPVPATRSPGRASPVLLQGPARVGVGWFAPMSVTVRFPGRTARARTRLLALVGSVVVTLCSLAVALPVQADETIRFDSPGDVEVSLIGDSTLAGVRWYADYGDLRRFDFVLNAESCRRTVEQSCISREGFRSATVVRTVESLSGDLGKVLVVMTGYNDPAASIDEAISAVVDGAREAGVEHVVWLSLRTSDDVDYSDPQEQSSVETFRQYNEQLVAAAEASQGFLQVADWATYSTGAADWFEYDGVHLTARGVDALTGYLATTIDRVLAGEDVSPAAAPWVVLVPGAEGPDVAALQAALLTAGIDLPGGADGVYGNDTMAAVAAYQREAGTLQVTGAVDAATASALGLYDDTPTEATAPATSVPVDPQASASTVPATVTDQVGIVSGPSTPEPQPGNGNGMTMIVAISGSIVALLAVAVVARGRFVAARRRRRWARVHPATSPLRSVVDDDRHTLVSADSSDR
jgi:peptidoglycan hydrolase-like protein with peptidoglycan-binding domain